MNPWIKMVRRFRDKFGYENPISPILSDAKEDELSISLLTEECNETCDAIRAGDMVEIADGVADIIYIALGVALKRGIDMDPIFEEVHRTNMAKTGGKTRADGKLMKPAGWTPPDIASLLEKQLKKKDKSNGK